MKAKRSDAMAESAMVCGYRCGTKVGVALAPRTSCPSVGNCQSDHLVAKKTSAESILSPGVVPCDMILRYMKGEGGFDTEWGNKGRECRACRSPNRAHVGVGVALLQQFDLDRLACA